MGMTFSRNFAPAVVVTTSLVAYFKVPKTRMYARAAYRLYMLTGILQVMADLLGFEDSLGKPLEIAFTWSYALGLPLLAAEVCCVNGVFSGFATLHILVPTATLIIYHYDVTQLDSYLLGVSHGYSMLAMVACGILTNRITPYGLTLVYYFTLYKNEQVMGSETGYRACFPQELGYPWQPHWTHCKYEAPPPPLPPPPPKRYLLSGKSCGKESPDKKDEAEMWSNVEAQTAFLGPNLWEKTLPYDTDLKYVDLDEFLSENGIPVEGGMGAGTAAIPQAAAASSSGCLKEPGRLSPATSASLVPVLTKREPSPSPSEAAAMSPLTISPPSPAESTLSFASSSRDAFDPRTRAFSDEELKPQPMVKKSRKQFVPEGLKDEKYWARRRKNNMAAKRSRDARRMKENQIALRAGFLEKENLGLRQEMDRLKKENMALRDQLSKFAPDAI